MRCGSPDYETEGREGEEVILRFSLGLRGVETRGFGDAGVWRFGGLEARGFRETNGVVGERG